MKDLHRWTIAAGLAALAGAGAAYVARGRAGHGPPPTEPPEAEQVIQEPPVSDDARDALDAARARLRARAEELHREIQDLDSPSH